MSLLDFACNGVDDLRCVVFEWGDELDERELVLIVHDLVFHSLDFEDVPLVAVADVDLVVGAMECGAHWVHCEFEGSSSSVWQSLSLRRTQSRGATRENLAKTCSMSFGLR